LSCVYRNILKDQGSGIQKQLGKKGGKKTPFFHGGKHDFRASGPCGDIVE
jgi:hypothetical protein